MSFFNTCQKKIIPIGVEWWASTRIIWMEILSNTTVQNIAIVKTFFFFFTFSLFNSLKFFNLHIFELCNTLRIAQDLNQII